MHVYICYKAVEVTVREKSHWAFLSLLVGLAEDIKKMVCTKLVFYWGGEQGKGQLRFYISFDSQINDWERAITSSEGGGGGGGGGGGL